MHWPEAILFAVDVDAEALQEAAVPGVTRLEAIKQQVHLYVQAKAAVDRRHAFGLAALTDAARWVTQGFTTNHNVFLDALGELLPSSTAPTPGGASYAAAVGGGATAHSGSSSASAGGGASLGAAAAAASSQHGAPSFQHWPSCDLGSLAQLAPPDSTALLDGGEQLGMHKVRVVLLYSRSGVVPRWAAAPLGQLPLDAIYIHQKALPGVNCPQDVYSALEDIADGLSERAGHAAYIFEVISANPKKLALLMTHLLAHPAQRPPQAELRTAPVDLAAAL